jgi:WD40 repeat protein
MNYISRIIELFSNWVGQINAYNEIRWYDINRYSEDIALYLLNKIYNYKLRNLNDEQEDYPAIDLGDEDNKIAFQITSSFDNEKIKKNLKTFSTKDVQTYTNGIYFLILTLGKTPEYKRKTKDEFKDIYPSFDPEHHIWTLNNLVKKIKAFKEDDKSKVQEIIEYLEKELNEIREKIKGLCPFRGLEVFQEKDQHFFFGREEVVRSLVKKLENSRFLAVMGLPRSGKSSVIQAGLIPELRKQELLITTFSPWKEPMDELVAALSKCYPEGKSPPLEQLANLLKNPGNNLDHIAREALEGSGKRNLGIVIDQFEELFIWASSEEEIKRFIEVVLNAVKENDGVVKVIITIRSDFIGKCAFYPDLNTYINNNSFQLGPMKQEQLQKVIEKPLQKKEIKIQDELVNKILEDVKGVPLELPLFENTLLVLYERRKDSMITLYDYNEIGGIEGALVKRVESRFAQLGDEQKEILRKMFILHLIQAGEGTGYSRRKAAKKTLLSVGENREAAEDLLVQWTKIGLLTFTWDNLRDDHYVEIAYEALIRKWGKIQVWMAEDGKAIRQLDILRHAALEWNNAGKNPDYLSQAAWLGQMEYLLKTHGKDLTELQINFINEGIALRQKKERERRESDAKELHRKKRIRQKILILVVAVLIAAVWAFLEKNRANVQYKEAVSNRLVAESSLVLLTDNIKAIRIAEAAYKIGMPHPSPPVQQALSAAAYSTFECPFYATNMEHDDRINYAEFLPGGMKIITTSRDNTAKLWNFKGKLLTKFNKHKNSVIKAVFFDNGNNTIILTFSDDNTAKLWDLNGDLLTDLKHGDKIFSAAFSLDGGKILTASRDKTAKLWDTKGNLLRTFNHESQVEDALFLDKCTKIITRSRDHPAKIWGLEGNLLKKLKHNNYISSVDFSFNRAMIITASWDKTAKVWNLNGDLLANLNKHTDYVYGATFSPDGKKIVTASRDKTAKIWDLNWNVLAELKHTDEVCGAVFTPDSDKILSWSGNTAKLWSVDGELLADSYKHKDEEKGPTFSPDGQNILTRWRNTAKLWDLNDNLLADMNKHMDYVSHAAFYSDDNWIITGSWDKTAKLWNLKNQLLFDLYKYKDSLNRAIISPNGDKIITWSEVSAEAKLWDLKGMLLANLNQHASYILSVTFSPDGNKILTGSSDNTAKLWNLQGKVLTSLQHTSQVTHTSFSRDGTNIITVSYDFQVRLWDLQGKFLASLNQEMSPVEHAALSSDGSKVLTWFEKSAKLWDLKGNLLADLKMHTGDITSAAFSPDGTNIITTSRDNTAKIWDLKGNLLTDLKKHTGPVTGAVFSRNGRMVLTISDDHTAKLWDLQGNLLADLNKHTDDVLSAVFTPEGDRIITISKDGTVKSWYTPEAIIQWLKTATIPKLSREDKENLGIANFKID